MLTIILFYFILFCYGLNTHGTIHPSKIRIHDDVIMSKTRIYIYLHDDVIMSKPIYYMLFYFIYLFQNCSSDHYSD